MVYCRGLNDFEEFIFKQIEATSEIVVEESKTSMNRIVLSGTAGRIIFDKKEE